MKIIASFDSADSADFAAGAVQRAVSPASSAIAKEYPAITGERGIGVFSAFNIISSNPTYSVPVFTPAAFAFSDGGREDHTRRSHTVEVICRKEEYPQVMRIITAHGGRNISKL